MSRVLSIDPGVRFTGAAIFDLDTKQLLKARRVRGAGFSSTEFGSRLWNLIDVAKDVVAFAKAHAPFSAVVFEWPQIYGKRQAGRKDPNDLLPLSAVDGAVLALMDPYLTDECQAELYVPHEWKGSKQANPTARMVLDELSVNEQKAIEDIVPFRSHLSECERTGTEVSHPAHNTIDAVGIGLKFLGRLERKRIIHR
jgi:hypothetical protein